MLSQLDGYYYWFDSFITFGLVVITVSLIVITVASFVKTSNILLDGYKQILSCTQLILSPSF